MQTLSLQPDLPVGTIVPWSGSIGSIPAAWSLCDGTNGTPDLRDRFMVGAGDTYTPGDTGGSSTHDHPFTANPHGHTLVAGTDISGLAGRSSSTLLENPSGTTDGPSNGPPHYALAFIQLTG